MKKNENGFTLVEILIALSLVTILVSAVAGLLSGLPRFYLDVVEQEGSGEMVDTALSFMAREIRFATMFHDDSDKNQLVFRVRIDGNDFDIHYVYDEPNHRLQRRRLDVSSGTEINEPMVDGVGEWEVEYSSGPADPDRFSQITLVLNGAQTTVRPRLFRGEDAGGGWYE